MEEALQKFVAITDEDELVEKMGSGLNESFRLLDLALAKTNWPIFSSEIILWSLKIVNDGMASDTLVDVACTILHKLINEELVGDIVFVEIRAGLLKILSRVNKYHYARFRAARVIFLVGMTEKLAKVISVNDLDRAIKVLREFSQDSDESIRQIALSDLSQIIN